MSRHLLTAKQIVAAADCDLADGDGLILRVNGLNAAAALRFTSPVTGARREMGLGSIRRDSLAAVGESLAAARHAAEDARRMLQRKRDPIEERDRERSEATTESGSENPASRRSLVTLRRYTRDYLPRPCGRLKTRPTIA